MKSVVGPRLVIAVPVKDLTHAKQRLMGVLSAAERGELARAMLRDVLRALAAAELDGAWVITRDPAAAAIARELGGRQRAEHVAEHHARQLAALARRVLDAARSAS